MIKAKFPTRDFAKIPAVWSFSTEVFVMAPLKSGKVSVKHETPLPWPVIRQNVRDSTTIYTLNHEDKYRRIKESGVQHVPPVRMPYILTGVRMPK